jgi:hypothetical protein
MVKKNVIKQDEDINFLLHEVADFVNLLKAVTMERSQEEEMHQGNDAWVGQYPYLRLYHVIMEDEIKIAYSKLFNAKDRAELDARNSAERPKNFYELAADKYNDQDYHPVTTTYPNLHDDFRWGIELHASDAPTATPSKIKEKLADVRAKLVIIINNWQRSGNGGGNKMDEVYNLQESQQALDDTETPRKELTYQDDDRRNYLGNNKPHLLYFWQKLDEGNILQNTLAVIPRDISADSEGIPSTLTPFDRKRKSSLISKYDEVSSTLRFQKDVRRSFMGLAKDSSMQMVGYYHTKLIDISEKYHNAAEGPAKDMFLRLMIDAEELYNNAKSDYEKKKLKTKECDSDSDNE